MKRIEDVRGRGLAFTFGGEGEEGKEVRRVCRAPGGTTPGGDRVFPLLGRGGGDSALKQRGARHQSPHVATSVTGRGGKAVALFFVGKGGGGGTIIPSFRFPGDRSRSRLCERKGGQDIMNTCAIMGGVQKGGRGGKNGEVFYP